MWTPSPSQIEPWIKQHYQHKEIIMQFKVTTLFYYSSIKMLRTKSIHTNKIKRDKEVKLIQKWWRKMEEIGKISNNGGRSTFSSFKNEKTPWKIFENKGSIMDFESLE